MQKIQNNNTKLIGAHVSAAGGVEKAVERVAEIGGNCLQVFSGSPRVWAKKPLDAHNYQQIRDNQEQLGVKVIFTHAIYLTNLASENSEILEKTRKSLEYDLNFDAKIGGSGVVVHLGSHMGRGWEAVRETVAQEVVELLARTDPISTFLIENSAGQNGKLCSLMSEIRWLIDRVGEFRGKVDGRLGWCFDTCHAHAAGYVLNDALPPQPPQSKNQSVGRVVDDISLHHLWSELRCIHVNDSKDSFGAGRDRHANIGEGELPLDALSDFLRQPQLTHVPLILEVPGADKSGPDQVNVDRLKKLINGGENF